MRDYKSVKVPRKYRSGTERTVVNRVMVSRRRSPGIGASGIKRAFLKLFVAVFIACGSYLGWQAYFQLTHAEMFQIAGVDVKGVHRITEDDLKEIAGVFTGQNIFQVDLDAAAQRARAHPWAKDVRIYRRLPNRVSMVFTERVPAAVLDTGRAQYLLDAEGAVIMRIAAKADTPLPRIVIKDRKVAPGEKAPVEGVDESLALLAELSSRGGWRPADVTVRADSAESLVLLYEGHEFRIGGGNYGRKLRRLAEIAADIKQRGLDFAYVDLRSDRQAAVMVRK